MNKYIINYEFGIALLYTPSEDWEGRFYALAEQCFGIRKNIGYVSLLGTGPDDRKKILDGEYERLHHNGDTIVWNEAGEKIKDEWDFDVEV